MFETLKTLKETDRGAFDTLWITFVCSVGLAVALFTATPLHAQGTGVGTLPSKTIEHRTPLLSAWQTLRIDADSGATMLIGSTHDSEETLPPDAGSQTTTQSWRWHHTTITVSTPRWVGETTDHWRTRHAEAVDAMMTRYQPDDT